MSDLISRQSLLNSLNRFAPEHFNALVNDLIMKEPAADHFAEDSKKATQPDVPDTNVGDTIRRSDVADKLTRMVNEMEGIFSNIRMKLVDDSVCGLCEYDCDHGIDGYANECPGFEKDDCFKLKEEYREEWVSTKELPSAQPEILAHGEGELSAQPEQRWIPCEERLPIIENNIGVRVLVTTSWGLVRDAYYCGDHWEREMNDIPYKLTSVIAWMPLPDCYQGG